MTTPHLQEVRQLIKHLHGVESRHIESVPVMETFQRKTVWDGVVEVFELHGHPKAPKAYAWSHEVDKQTTKGRRHVTVLHIPPVTSPVLAVRAAIVQEFRANEMSKEKARNVGRPRMPKGQAKGRIVPVRVSDDEYRAMMAKAKTGKTSLSEWIRVTLSAAI